MKKLIPLALLVGALAVPSAASAREVEGTVVAVNRDARTFTLVDEGVRTKVKVTSRTRYQRLSGFSAIKRGMTGVEAIVTRKNGR